MTLREDLLNPISEESPGGRDIRYDPVYDEIKEARREDDAYSQGVWASERKVADYGEVSKLTQKAIATESKDLQLSFWLTEAALKLDGYNGLLQGLDLNRNLLEKFWDHLFPELEDGDPELRVAALERIGTLEVPLKEYPLNVRGHSFFKYKESRTVGYESAATNEATRKAREKAIKEGKLTAEVFDSGFGETPKATYLQAEKALDGCIKALAALNKVCDEKFGTSGPSFMKLSDALKEVRHTVHGLLEKKRETEPDPVEEAPPPEPEAEAAAAGEPGAEHSAGLAAAPQAGGVWIPAKTNQEPASRRDAVAAIANAAAQLRQREPFSPAPYLLLRGLRWGELRAAAAAGDQTAMEAPPTEIRQEIKRLALKSKWKELLDMAENVMSLPCSRAWLDLQRFVVEACVALGDDYNIIAVAIRSELRALLRDVPALLDARLLDDTAAANAETQAWLKGLMQESNEATPDVKPEAIPVRDDHVAGWQKTFIDSFTLAGDALKAGQEQKAFELMFKELERQRSGRGRFQRKLQLVQLCMSAGKDTIAQPILEDLAAAVENHKLEDWEDREMVANALATIMRCSKKIQGDAKEKQKMFERICRLDPVRALTAG